MLNFHCILKINPFHLIEDCEPAAKQDEAISYDILFTQPR